MKKKFRTGIVAYCLLPIAVFGRDSRKITYNPVDPFSDTIPSQNHKNHKKPIKVQTGVASFYSNKFEGRKTYTDEIFSQKKLTAASNTLPMHTWIRVTNLRNKKSVIVRINDKMHPKNKRLIDLSRAAAHKLGYTGRGLTRVKIEVLGKKRPPDAEKEDITEEKVKD
ncbi:septal ring lytic transglycosylase RlpA family protein [Flavitalea flava]